MVKARDSTLNQAQDMPETQSTALKLLPGSQVALVVSVVSVVTLVGGTFKPWSSRTASGTHRKGSKTSGSAA